MSQVRGDDTEKIVEQLVAMARVCIESAAGKDAKWTSEVVRDAKLRRAMESAVRVARNGPAQIDKAQRLAAAAALKLIENGASGSGGSISIGRIFSTPADQLPTPPGPWGRYGLLVVAAYKLAENFAREHRPPLSTQVEKNRLAASFYLCDLLKVSAGNLKSGQPQHHWWDRSFAAITQMVGLFALSDSEFERAQRPTLESFPAPKPEFVVKDGSTDAPQPGSSEPSGPPSVDTPPKAQSRHHRWRTAHRNRWVRLGLTMTLPVLLVIGAAEYWPAIPRIAFGWQNWYADDYPIPPLPPGPKLIESALTLPNTTVQLFWMKNGSEQLQDAQTSNGRLPEVAAAVMPPEYQIATFQVRLSRTYSGKLADNRLKLWIQVPPPMVVVGATRMKDPQVEGDPEPDLNSLDKDNGGSAVDVPPLDDVPYVLYQFRVEARPDRTNNGYLCGYNAKFVQVMVRSEDKTKTSQDGVVIPYPLYVPRGEGC